MEGAIFMKRFISSLLTGVMILGLAMPVSAQANEQQRFMTSLNATYRQLEREYVFANRYMDVQYELLDTLAHSAYETVVEISADFLGQTAGMETSSRFGLNNGGLSSVTELFGLRDLMFIPDFSISFYMNNDIVAIGSDLIGDNYFYVERSLTADEFAQSEIAQAGIITYNELMFLLATLQSALDVPTFADMQLTPPEGLLERYADVFVSSFSYARFISAGQQFVRAERGNIITEKVTARMDADLVSSLLNDLADTLENDAELSGYIGSFLPSEMQMFVDMGIAFVADELRAIAYDWDGNIDFSLYIASNGLAVRQSLDIDFNDRFETNIVFNVDLLGRDFLINEMGFGMIVNEFGSELGVISLTSTGNNIMRGGINESITTLIVDFDGMFIEVVVDYWWDANLTEDNFTMDIAVFVDDPWSGPIDFTIYTKGTFYISAEELILEFTATSPMTLLLLGDADASLRFFTAMRAISADLGGLAGTGVNIVDIAADSALLDDLIHLLDQGF